MTEEGTVYLHGPFSRIYPRGKVEPNDKHALQLPSDVRMQLFVITASLWIPFMVLLFARFSAKVGWGKKLKQRVEKWVLTFIISVSCNLPKRRTCEHAWKISDDRAGDRSCWSVSVLQRVQEIR